MLNGNICKHTPCIYLIPIRDNIFSCTAGRKHQHKLPFSSFSTFSSSFLSPFLLLPHHHLCCPLQWHHSTRLHPLFDKSTVRDLHSYNFCLICLKVWHFTGQHRWQLAFFLCFKLCLGLSCKKNPNKNTIISSRLMHVHVAWERVWGFYLFCVVIFLFVPISGRACNVRRTSSWASRFNTILL